MLQKTNKKSSIANINLEGFYAELYNWEDKKENGGIAESGDFASSKNNGNFVITKKHIQDVISGKSKVKYGDAIHAASDYLRNCKSPSDAIKGSNVYKKQEAECLKSYARKNHLLIPASAFKGYFNRGREQKVYLVDERNVNKINNVDFYDSWDYYFISLLLNNYFFPDTAYELIGFTEEDDILHSVVRQKFVEETEPTDLDRVKKFMVDNGFENTKDNNYYHRESGIIIEDLHDENVLTKNGLLEFVDTVFYLIENTNKKYEDGGVAQKVKIVVHNNTNSASDRDAQRVIMDYLKNLNISGRNVFTNTLYKLGQNIHNYDVVFYLNHKYHEPHSDSWRTVALKYKPTVEEAYNNALFSDDQSPSFIRIWRKDNVINYVAVTEFDLFGDYSGDMYDEKGNLKQEVKDGAIKDLKQRLLVNSEQKMEYGGTAQFDSGATTLVGHDLMRHINNSKDLTDKKNRLYEQAHIYGWSEDTLYKMFKNAFSVQVVKDYNSRHENKITLDDHQKADLAHALADSFTLWKIDNDIELERGGEVKMAGGGKNPIIDEVLYHGTQGKFDKIESGQEVSNPTYGGIVDNSLGKFFTNNKTMAEWFGGAIEFDGNSGKYKPTKNKNARVLKERVRLYNPYIIDSSNPEYDIDNDKDSVQIYFDEIEASGGAEKYKKKLLSKGYDGIVLRGNTTNYYEDGKTYDMYVVFDSAEMEKGGKNEIYNEPIMELPIKSKGKDTIGRDIPDWRGAKVYHTTDKEGYEDISNHGYRLVGDGYYGRAISFTPDLKYSQQFGGKNSITTLAKISADAKILNLNDPKDWGIWLSLTKIAKGNLGKYNEVVTSSGYDGVYDAGAGDLFIYNPKAISYVGVVKMAGGGIPKRYKNLGFNRVGQKKKSTRSEKKWMVLAKKGDKYKVVHGGQKGMEDFSQHHDKTRQKRFWNRMGGFDSAKASDPFSPLYWHKRFGTWEAGGVLDKGTIKVAWVDSDTPDIMESKMFGSVEDALKYSKDKKFLIFELEDTHDDYYKWTLLPYGMYDKYKMALNWADSLNLMDQGGIADADKQAEAERLAKKFLATLSEEQIADLQQEVHRIVDSVIVEEEKKLFDLEDSQEALQSEDKQLFEKQKSLEYGEEKDKVSARRREIYSELRNLKSKIRTQQNIVKAIRNGGDLTSFTDKKGLEYSRIPSFSKIKSDFIAFEEETILAQDVPAYIPIIDEETFKQKGYVFDAIRIAPDQYILAVNGFGIKIEYGNVLDLDAGYVITTLDQLALINDYYFTKAKAHGLKEAEESTKRNEEYYDKLPREKREKHLNQPNFYHSLPVAVKKKISKENYEALSLEDKESFYKPFKKYSSKRLVSKLQDDQMWKSFHRMYETFVDPEATEIKTSELQKWVDKGLITAEAAELTKKRSSSNAVWGHPTVFAYWKSFREMMKWKIKDIQVQRETDSEIRKIALETSFGESNTNDALKERYGILVKRQDGSKILPEQIDQIRKAWENVNKVFGTVVNNAKEANLKISHTGIKYVYASKAAGMFVPQMKTIAVTNKFGDEQFQSIMAHETAHWIDYAIGHLKSKRYASDDFESPAGLVAMAMRSNMNAPSDSDYVNATTECFARAMEQYFAFEIFGEEATLLYSYGELKEVRTYHAEDKYVSKENFNSKIKPLVQNFLTENKSWFEFGIEKMETGGKVVTSDGSQGGIFIGPAHSEGGMPTIVKETGEKIEVEGLEAHLVPAITKVNKKFRCVGKPKSVLSKINQLGGGANFSEEQAQCEIIGEEGETEKMDMGNKVADKKPITEISGDVVSVPASSMVINKKNTQMEEQVSCEGTLSGMASAINELNNNGVHFADHGKCRLVKKQLNTK